VGRALAQLGIEHTAAYWPQARGRSERTVATLQDRLVKEHELAGITTLAATNRFIKEVYLSDHNARLTHSPELSEDAFVPAALEQVTDILCRREERIVGNDNTVRHNGLCLQLPKSPARAHVVKARGGSTSIPTSPRPSVTAPGAWPATAPIARSSMTPNWPRDPLRLGRRAACG
jgi:hypothetical protein